MAITRIFIDGQEGTTGLQLRERLACQTDLTLLEIPVEARKDPTARRALINQADFVFTCLPDAAARETVALLENPTTRVIDPSTAHRTAKGWTYGLPELRAGQREAIRTARYVAVPGCHATGFLVGWAPLVAAGIVPADYPIVVRSLTGYSGGGRAMIHAYESATDEEKKRLQAPRPYGLNLQHKHLPEMQAMATLTNPPLFEPVVVNVYQGMLVSIPLWPRLLPTKVTAQSIHTVLAQHYQGERFVDVKPFQQDEHGRTTVTADDIDLRACNGTNRIDVFVCGHDEQVLIITRFDNLGKGASGAALQNLNIMRGVDEAAGLC